MNGAFHVLFRPSQRALRVLLLLAMAWILGAAGVTHTHAGTPVRTVASMTQASTTDDKSVLVAASEDETCAICLWKARTPYVPFTMQPTALPLVISDDHQVATPRAPPSYSIERPRSRAPPSYLS